MDNFWIRMLLVLQLFSTNAQDITQDTSLKFDTLIPMLLHSSIHRFSKNPRIYPRSSREAEWH
jgi:hypothetical protein